MAGNCISMINWAAKGRQYDQTPIVRTQKFANMVIPVEQGKAREHCPHCGTVIQRGKKICSFCHVKIERRAYNLSNPESDGRRKQKTCPYCESPLKRGVTDCHNCGAMLWDGLPDIVSKFKKH